MRPSGPGRPGRRQAVCPGPSKRLAATGMPSAPHEKRLGRLAYDRPNPLFFCNTRPYFQGTRHGLRATPKKRSSFWRKTNSFRVVRQAGGVLFQDAPRVPGRQKSMAPKRPCGAGCRRGGRDATPPGSLPAQDNGQQKTAVGQSRPPLQKSLAKAALPVLILGLVGLLGLDQQQGNEDGRKPEQHDKPGEIKFHGEPPEMFL